jgi:two-component system invasion response regulator UvrY
MKALLIDDHAIVRSSLKSVLAEMRNFTVLEAATGKEAIEIQKREKPQFIVLDLALPDIGGLDLLRRIVDTDHTAKVLVCSMHHDSAHVSLSLKIGARGYVSKRVTPSELKTAIREVVAGRSFVEAEIVAKSSGFGSNQPPDFSEREINVLRLLAKGQSYNQIAEIYGVSYKTIANAAGQIRSRLNLSSTAELIRFSVQLYGRD